MNQIAPRHTSTPAPASQKPSVGQLALQGEMNTMLPADLLREVAEARDAVTGFAQLGWNDEGRRISAEETAKRLSVIPSAERLEGLANRLQQAITVPADDRVNRILIGLLMDAFPNARAAQPATYADALANDLLDLGFPPFAVAAGLQKLRRTSKFLPVVAEVLESVDAAQRAQHSQVVTLRNLRDMRVRWGRERSSPFKSTAIDIGDHQPQRGASK